VNIVAYIEGDTAFTESYFQDGGSVVKGKIEVYDSFHNLLLTGVTGEEGEFSFANPRLDDLTVVLEAALGHRATCTLTPDESHTGITREDTRSENRGTSY
jgi:nickel transport protein